MTIAPIALRLTKGHTSHEAPDLAAFTAVNRVLLREQLADHDDKSPVTDLIAASTIASHVRLITNDEAPVTPVFVTLRGSPIPPIASSSALPVADARNFELAKQIHGHFAWQATPRRSRAGAVLVMAVCIPLSLPDVAMARPPAPPPPPRPPIAVTEPVANPTLPNLETILQAMNGRHAVVFVGAATVSGQIIGVDSEFVTLVDERDGKIATVPKAQITEVRAQTTQHVPEGPQPARTTAPEDLPTGKGGVISGAILVSLGGPLLISGIVFAGLSPSSPALWLGLAVPANALLGAGIPLLAVGVNRRKTFRAATQKPRLGRMRPWFGRTRGGGWTGGLVLQF